MHQLRSNKEKLKKIEKCKATGLIEVVVVIAILSITMVTVLSVTTRGLRQVKRDEIEDQALGLQFQALELAKSPATLRFPGDVLPGDIRSYSVDYSNSAGSNTNLIEATTSIDLSIDNCDEGSPYYVDYSRFEPGSSGNVFCNQVKVEVDENSGRNFYSIKSIVVYKSVDGFEKKELIAFRSE